MAQTSKRCTTRRHRLVAPHRPATAPHRQTRSVRRPQPTGMLQAIRLVLTGRRVRWRELDHSPEAVVQHPGCLGLDHRRLVVRADSRRCQARHRLLRCPTIRRAIPPAAIPRLATHQLPAQRPATRRLRSVLPTSQLAACPQPDRLLGRCQPDLEPRFRILRVCPL
jgi:hypothetical protein